MIDRDTLDPASSRKATFSAKESSTMTGSPLRGHKSMNPRTVLARSRCQGKRTGQGHAGRMGEVDAGADRNRFQAVRVHVLIEARNVGDDFAVRRHIRSFPDG